MSDVKITQEEIYEYLKTLPKTINSQTYHEYTLTPIIVYQNNKSQRLTIGIQQKGFQLPITLAHCYTPDGYRKPLQVTTLFLWSTANEGLQRHYQQHQTPQHLDISKYALQYDYLVLAENISEHGVMDQPAHIYLLEDGKGNQLTIKQSGYDEFQVWLNNQPIQVDRQQQNQIQSHLSFEMVHSDEFSALVEDEREYLSQFDLGEDTE